MATGTEVLDTGRGDHVVVFYRDEQELVGQVSEYLLPAAQEAGVAIVVATPGHHRAFEERLASTGADVAAARRRGSYLTLDAGETIRGFMVADWPIPLVSAGDQPPAPASRRGRKPVRVFGEMVSLLWDADLVSAAIEVEAMWNELAGQYPFSLLCAYRAQQVSCAHHLDALTEVCRAHTHVIGGPPGSEEARPHGL